MPKAPRPAHKYRYAKRNSLHRDGEHASLWPVWREQNRQEATYPYPLILPNRRGMWRVRREWEKATRGRRLVFIPNKPGVQRAVPTSKHAGQKTVAKVVRRNASRGA